MWLLVIILVSAITSAKSGNPEYRYSQHWSESLNWQVSSHWSGPDSLQSNVDGFSVAKYSIIHTVVDRITLQSKRESWKDNTQNCSLQQLQRKLNRKYALKVLSGLIKNYYKTPHSSTITNKLYPKLAQYCALCSP